MQRKLSQLKQFREEDTVVPKLEQRDVEHGKAIEIAAKKEGLEQGHPIND